MPARLFVLWSSLKPTRSPSSLASQGHWLCSVGHGLCSGVAGLGGFQVFLVRLSGREGSKATPAVGRALEQLPARVGAPAAACQPASHSVLWSLPPSGLRRGAKPLAGTTPWAPQVGTRSAEPLPAPLSQSVPVVPVGRDWRRGSHKATHDARGRGWTSGWALFPLEEPQAQGRPLGAGR